MLREAALEAGRNRLRPVLMTILRLVPMAFFPGEGSEMVQPIASDELPRIFDPFFRGTRTRNEQGFGIGLSIVKSIIEARGASGKVR